ncbi:MAG TPA: acyl-CoA dehydrogenase family protein [Candidatus Binataceae bacterium]|nr:acyl-CoA dehydrogenase family protein [Candidatus Binataceae bacterium]
MIDFDLSDDQQAVREAVEKFARDEVRPAARAAEEAQEVPPHLLRAFADFGFTRALLPAEFGGAGETRSILTGAVVAEALAWGDMAIALHGLSSHLLALPILEWGSPAQRRQFLPRLAQSDFQPGAAAWMEPRFDFDLSAISLSASPNGDGAVLNGDKCCVPLAAQAETIVVLASDPRRALQLWLVPRQTPGLKLGERERKMGLNGLATYSLHMENCRVPAAALLGEGQACDFARLVAQSRVALAAMGVGLARAAFEYARDYARERRAFGAPIATRQAIAFMLAEMAIEVDAARLLVWEAAVGLDHGRDRSKEAYLARDYVADAALKIADNAVQILGGHGYVRDHPVELWLRNARGLISFEGLALV